LSLDRTPTLKKKIFVMRPSWRSTILWRELGTFGGCADADAPAPRSQSAAPLRDTVLVRVLPMSGVACCGAGRDGADAATIGAAVALTWALADHVSVGAGAAIRATI
jgi:hypothetical protein